MKTEGVERDEEVGTKKSRWYAELGEGRVPKQYRNPNHF